MNTFTEIEAILNSITLAVETNDVNSEVTLSNIIANKFLNNEVKSNNAATRGI